MAAELLAAWGFEATPVVDETGNGHDITLTGGTVLTAPGAGQFGGRGLTQTGGEVFTAFAMPPELQPPTRSWMCDVEISGQALGWVGEFYNQDENTGAWGMVDLRDVGGTFQFRCKDSGLNEHHVNLTPPGVFTNICGTYDGTNMRVYTDGALIGTVASPDILTATHFRLIDSLGTTTKIDNMRLFSGVLTPEEIDVWRFLPANEMPPGAPTGGKLKYESAPGVWTPVQLKTETGDPLVVKTETGPGTWEVLP